MFSKSLISSVVISLGLVLQVSAHAVITPALGIVGRDAIRADVQRPAGPTAECGTMSIPDNLDTSTAAIADPNGIVNLTITNFNSDVDGSRMIVEALVDTTGIGNFDQAVAATMLVNGEFNPTDVTSQPLSVQLPAGVQCAGGAAANKCLLSFITAGDFGNCVVVQQSA